MKRPGSWVARLILGWALVTLPAVPVYAAAKLPFNLGQQSLARSLLHFAQTTGVDVAFQQDQFADVISPSVRGEKTARDAMRHLLQGSGAHATWITETAVIVSAPKRDAAAPAIGNLEAVPLTLDTVLVSAQIPAPATFAPGPSRFVVSGLDAQISNIDSLEPLSERVPNMVLGLTDQRGQPIISIRGISNLYGIDKAAAVMVDGIKVARGLSNAVLFDQDSIEIIRGPSGVARSVYALAGSLDIRSRAPEPEFSGNLGLAYGRFDQWRVSGVLNVPVNDDVAIRISGLTEQSDSLVHNLARPDAPDNASTDLIRIQAQAALSDQLELNLLASYSGRHERQVPLVPTGLLIGTGDPIFSIFPLNPDDLDFFPENQTLVSHNRESSAEDESWLTRLRLIYRGDKLTVVSQTSYADQSLDLRFDSDSTSLDILHEQSESRYRHWAQDIEVDLQATDNLDLMFQLAAVHETASQAIVMGPGALHPAFGAAIAPDWAPEAFGPVLWATQSHRRILSLSPQIGAEWRVLDALSVEAKLKYLWQDLHQTDRQAEYAAGPTLFEGSKSTTFHKVLPYVSLDYQVAKNAHLFASVAKGRRLGGSAALFFEEPIGFAEETLWSYEAGASFASRSKHVQLRLIGFYSDAKNLQIPGVASGQYLGGSGESLTNVLLSFAEGRSYGFELDLKWQPINALLITAALGYTDARWRFNDNFQGTIGDHEDSSWPLPYAPRWSAALDGEYQFILSNSWQGFLRAEWRYKSTFSSDLLHPLLAAYEDVLSPARNIVNFRAGISNSGFALLLFVENAFGEDYFDTLGNRLSLAGQLVRPNPTRWGIEFGVTF